MEALNGELSDITDDEVLLATEAVAVLWCRPCPAPPLDESILFSEALLAKSGLLHNLDDDTIDEA
jgi:hypothetical protein